MSCRCDDDALIVDSNGCFNCVDVPKVKGRFGLAWVSESPECPRPEPVGWQVEFLDTPSKVEQKCQEMVRWINCPPLPRCDPCPPDELCSPSNPPRCNPCAPKCNPCLPKCPLPKCSCKNPQASSQAKCRGGSRPCCCCKSPSRPKRACFPPMGTPYCRTRSPRRRGNVCSCDKQDTQKCTCDDIPTKDTNNGIGSSSGTYNNYDTNQPYNSTYTYSPQQVTPIEDNNCSCSKPTLTLYRNQNDNQYNTDTEYSRNDNNDDDDDNGKQKGDCFCYNHQDDQQGGDQSNKNQRPQKADNDANRNANQRDQNNDKCDCDCCTQANQQAADDDNDGCRCYADREQPQRKDQYNKQQQPPPNRDKTDAPTDKDQQQCDDKNEKSDKPDGKSKASDYPDDSAIVQNGANAGDATKGQQPKPEPKQEPKQQPQKPDKKFTPKRSDSVNRALRMQNGQLDDNNRNNPNRKLQDDIDLERILAEAEKRQQQQQQQQQQKAGKTAAWLSPWLFRLCFKSRANRDNRQKEQKGTAAQAYSSAPPPSATDIAESNPEPMTTTLEDITEEEAS